MDLRHELADRLASFASGQAALRDFDRWFSVHVLGEVERTGDAELVDAAYRIESDIATYADGVWTRDELRAMLAEHGRRLAATRVAS